MSRRGEESLSHLPFLASECPVAVSLVQCGLVSWSEQLSLVDPTKEDFGASRFGGGASLLYGPCLLPPSEPFCPHPKELSKDP